MDPARAAPCAIRTSAFAKAPHSNLDFLDANLLETARRGQHVDRFFAANLAASLSGSSASTEIS